MGVAQNPAALKLAQDLRRAGLTVEVGDGNFRLKKSFEAADKLARRMVIFGEDEAASGVLTVEELCLKASSRRFLERSLRLQVASPSTARQCSISFTEFSGIVPRS